jgi:4-amino-4-deoxy-L-arabinose transferase-like glycosyltransferase
LTPYWKFTFFFEKPPLTFWIRTALFHCFGVSEFWARAESALAGIGIVLLTFAIARRASGLPAGLFAGFVLLTMKQFDHEMREAMCDAPLCFCIYLALYGYVRLREGSHRWWYLICAAVGVGAMIKGPAIAVAPAIALARFLNLESDDGFWFTWQVAQCANLRSFRVIEPLPT